MMKSFPLRILRGSDSIFIYLFADRSAISAPIARLSIMKINMKDRLMH